MTFVPLCCTALCMPIIAAMLVDPARLLRRSCNRARPLRSSGFAHFTPDSRLAWVRLALALAIGSIGAVGMWSVVVVLPVVQAEFGATPRRRFAGLHAHHAGLRPRRRRHRQNHRPFRHRRGDVAEHRLPRHVLCAGRTFDHAVAIHRRVFPDRAWNLGDLRAPDGGGLALVRALSRARGDHRRQRQLCRRHDLAAADHLGHQSAGWRATHIAHRAFSRRWR